MENKKNVEPINVSDSKPAKQKKKENVEVINTNLKFSCISLFVLCAVLIGVGIFMIAGLKAYFGGVLLILFGIAFSCLNIWLCKTLFFKKQNNNK